MVNARILVGIPSLSWNDKNSHIAQVGSGLPLFSFEVHLPFFAVRKHQKACNDERRLRNGKPLRSSKDITFLRTLSEKNDNSGDDILYEAKVSLLVSGWDRFSWVAYMFIDLYFEDSRVDEDLESIKDYEHHEHLGTKPDPFTAAEKTAKAALSDPREYFLQVFAIRLTRVKKEWGHLLLHHRMAIATYVS